MIGTSLLHYEIIEKLGEGGMGVVYKARDMHLDRFVAIKVLPPERVADPQRKARFVQEAKAASALNHSNIVTIHDISNDAGVDFIAMEFVAGKTLDQLIPRKGMRLREALRIAIQVSDAMARAHAAGIVHRDLKPSNVMVDEHGLAKVLDFGLAKLTEQTPAEDGSTVTMGAKTDEGTIVGTASYMSPEQAEGKPVDARSDIFSLGALVYEMVTGRRAFRGASRLSILSALLKEEPPPASSVCNVPHELERIVALCLRKDPERRFQHMDDVRIALEELKEESDSGTAAIKTESPRRRAGPLIWAAMVVGVLVAAAVAMWLRPFDREPPELRVLKFAVQLPHGTSVSGDALAISPSGRLLTYSGTSEGRTLLWLHSLDSLTARPLPGTEDAMFPFWSPDSRFIGFFAQGKLKEVEISSGTPRTLCPAPFGVGGAWSRDGVILFAPSFSSALFRVSASGGEPAPVTTLDSSRGEKMHRWPCFLPDGRHFVYFIKGNRQEVDGIYLSSLDSSPAAETKRLLLRGGSMAVYTPPGYLLFARNGTLMAQRFDTNHLQPGGGPFPVGEQLVASPVYGFMPFSVSTNGVLGYRSGKGSTQLTWFDRKGNQIGTLGTPGVYFFPDLSPDGNRLAVGQGDPDQGSNIWLVEIPRGASLRFTFGPGSDRAPVWSPDGGSIVYASNREGPDGLYQKQATGSGEDVLLLPSTDIPWGWSKDGRLIVYSILSPKTGYDIWALEVGGEPRPVLQSRFNEWQARLSPDEHWIAYASDESGTFEVYVQSYPTTSSSPARKWQVSTAGGSEPRWRRDGAELFYIAADGRLMVVEMKGRTPFQAGMPEPLFQTRLSGFRGYDVHYVVSNDGTRFLINTPVNDTAMLPIIVEINWAERLKSLR